MLKQYKANWTTFDNLDMELFVTTEIFKLRSLHYGYWEPEESLTLENLRRAQIRYTETLLEMIPPDVMTILDVGAGIGDNAQALCNSGYSVTAISPDLNHAQYFEKMLAPKLRFVPSKFEDFIDPGIYDLILMSESHVYFHMDAGFAQCRRLLRPGGYLLVSGMFSRDDGPNIKAGRIFYDYFDSEMDYKTRAEIYGLQLIQNVDITSQTLPTLALAYDMYCDKLVPFMAMAEHYLNSSAGWKWKLLKIVLRKQFRELTTMKQMYDHRLNPEVFQNQARYMRMLFQLPRA